MKRSERNKVKTDPDQRHPGPHHDEADNHECRISSSINVQGEVEAKRPPDLTKERTTERKEDNTREKKKFVVEIATLVVVAIYAGITFWQGCLTRDIAKLTQRTYDTSQRPYIGISGISPVYTSLNADGTEKIASRTALPETSIMIFRAEIKNFGPVPGTNFKLTWKVSVNGVLHKDEHKIPDAPAILFPTQPTYLVGSVQGTEYHRLINGDSHLVLEISIEYDGPSGHYKSCEKNQYAPDINGFFNLGNCTSSGTPVTAPG